MINLVDYYACDRAYELAPPDAPGLVQVKFDKSVIEQVDRDLQVPSPTRKLWSPSNKMHVADR